MNVERLSDGQRDECKPVTLTQTDRGIDGWIEGTTASELCD